jgi:hypothetical protein
MKTETQPLNNVANIASSLVPQTISRWRAASIHLLISGAIALAVVALMRLLWYPQPYFYGMDAFGLLMLLLSVDVILGPLITLVIFNPAKKSLKFDLTIVALIQIVALLYGIYMMFQARPVYSVFNDDRFDVVIYAELSPVEQAKIVDERFRYPSMTGPDLVAMDVPKDSKELMRMMFSGTNTRAFSQYYVPYVDRASVAAKAAHPLSLLSSTKPESAVKVREYIRNRNLDEASVVWLPFFTRVNDMTILLKRDTGEIIGIVPVPSAD